MIENQIEQQPQKNDDSKIKNPNSEFTEEKYRFAIILLFMVVDMDQALINISISAASEPIFNDFQVSDFQFQICNVVYNLLFPPANFLANQCLDHIGIKFGMTIGLCLTTVGSLIRIFIQKSFTYVIIGSSLAAFGGPFIHNVIPKISVFWFKPESRMISTTLMAGSFIFGLSFGFFLENEIVTKNSIDSSTTKAKVEEYLIIISIITVIVLFVFIVFFRDKPAKDTSVACSIEREPFISALKKLFKNKDYLYLNIAFSILLGNFVAFVWYLYQFLKPFNFTVNQINNLGGIMNFACGTGKMLAGFVVGKYIAIKTFLVWETIFYSILMILFLLLAWVNSAIMLQLISIALGAFLQIHWGPCLEYACQIVFPIGEANAAGGLISGGCILSILVTYIYPWLFSMNTTIAIFFSQALFMVTLWISTYCFGNITGKLVREEIEMGFLENSAST